MKSFTCDLSSETKQTKLKLSWIMQSFKSAFPEFVQVTADVWKSENSALSMWAIALFKKIPFLTSPLNIELIKVISAPFKTWTPTIALFINEQLINLGHVLHPFAFIPRFVFL